MTDFYRFFSMNDYLLGYRGYMRKVYFSFILILFNLMYIASAEDAEILTVFYQDLLTEGEPQSHQLADMNDYLLNKLQSSSRIILTSESNLQIRGSVRVNKEQYILTLSLYDSEKELAAYSKPLLSLDHYQFVVDSVVSRIEGYSLLGFGMVINEVWKLEEINPIVFEEIDFHKIYFTELGTPAAPYSDKLMQCFTFFNDDLYSESIEKLQELIRELDEVDQSSTENLQKTSRRDIEEIKKKSEVVLLQAEQRLELVEIQNRFRAFVSNKSSIDSMSLYHQLESLQQELDKDWIDRREVEMLHEQLRESLSYCYKNSLKQRLNTSSVFMDQEQFLEAFALYNELFSEYTETYRDRLDRSGQQLCIEMFRSTFRFLCDNYLSYGINQFHRSLEDSNLDRAYTVLKECTDFLKQQTAGSALYKPDLRTSDKNLHRLWNISDRLLQADLEAFKFSSEYFRSRQDSSALADTTQEFYENLIKSIHIDRYITELDESLFVNPETEMDSLRSMSRSYAHDEREYQNKMNNEIQELSEKIERTREDLQMQEEILTSLFLSSDNLERQSRRRVSNKRALFISSAATLIASGACLYMSSQYVNDYENSNNTPDLVEAREKAELWASLSAGSAGVAGGLSLWGITLSTNKRLGTRVEINRTRIESVRTEIAESKATLSVLQNELDKIME